MNQNKEETYILRLYNIFRKMIRNEIRYTVHDAVVTAVDESKFTFDAKILETEYFGIPLNVLKSEQASIVEVPKKGTDCILTFREFSKARPQALKFHELDKILVTIGASEMIVEDGEINVKIGESTIKIKDGEIIFNDGNLGIPLSDKVADKIAAVEGKINDILKALSAITIKLAPTGTVPFKPFFSAILPINPTTKDSDIENTKIKQ